ncbi:hypothetical protein [Desulfovibrio inopinatus]|uniref:hypothetical protein n=1 Tax=Desulfovibrio inopinatus TaxID=102109 RepID=UPI0004232676|nr:hypothetical protein [Desulfovibrio inopinatus]
MPDSTVTPLRDLDIIKAREEQQAETERHDAGSREPNERIDQLNTLREKTAKTAADIGRFLKQQKELLIEQKQIRFNLKVMGKGITPEEETRFNRIIKAYEKKVGLLQQQLRAVEFINDCLIVGMRAENLKSKLQSSNSNVREQAKLGLKRLQPVVRTFNKKIASSLYNINPTKFGSLNAAVKKRDDVSVVQQTMGGLVDSYSRNLAADKATSLKQSTMDTVQGYERQKIQEIYKQKTNRREPTPEPKLKSKPLSPRKPAQSVTPEPSLRPKTSAFPDIAGRHAPKRLKEQKPAETPPPLSPQQISRQTPPSPSTTRSLSRPSNNLFSDSGMGISAEKDMQTIYDRVFDEMLEEYEVERKKKRGRTQLRQSRLIDPASGDEPF